MKPRHHKTDIEGVVDATDPLLVIVTGLSGAGLTTAINTLQDNGFYCIDNLPFELLWDTVALVQSGKIQARGFAFGMDIRDHRFATDFPKIKAALSEKIQLDVLFVESDAGVLAKRYLATRRRHPLLDSNSQLDHAIESEVNLLKPVRDSADAVLDTTHLKPTELSRLIESRYTAGGLSGLRSLFVTIASFGFKYGAFEPAEIIQDIRFLPNPFFEPTLKHKTGINPEVRKYIMDEKVSKQTFEKLIDLYSFLIPLYHKEGKHYLRIGIGCTGGQHRSVTFAEGLAKALEKLQIPSIQYSVIHRDIERH